MLGRRHTLPLGDIDLGRKCPPPQRLLPDPQLRPDRLAGGRRNDLSAGHTVMVSKPRELAAIINDAVGRNEITEAARHS